MPIMPITGKWFNELNSWMDVEVSGNTINGIYHNSAGLAAGDYLFSGVIDSAPKGSNQSVAWAVTWIRMDDGMNFHCVTSWSGQYQLIYDKVTEEDVETITSEWLLTMAIDPDDDWESTKIGHDVFTRTPPSEALVKARLKAGPRSHPNKKAEKTR
jgi:hypothetical protein